MSSGIADYQFTGELGAGNHGRFYIAKPPPRLSLDDDVVAVKVLDQDASDADFNRVANELKLFHSVKSAYLVRIYDAGYESGRLFYTTPYYREGSLESPAGELARHQRLVLVADAARGAHDLHEAGVVHRDIKPANVLIEDGRGRLADLGLARLISPDSNKTGIGPVGSIEFMSPDIVLGERGSRATDLWALGVTLHYTLTGTGIYGTIPDANVMDAFTYVLKTQPRLSPDLPEAYRVIIGRCLKMEDPYATAAELAEDIDAAAETP